MKQKQANVNKTCCIIFDYKFSTSTYLYTKFLVLDISVQEYINRNSLYISLKQWI